MPLALVVTTDLAVLAAAQGAAERAGVAFRSVAPASAESAASESAPHAVAIDLSAPIGDITELVASLRAATPGARLVAFGPHVHEARLEAARNAGCDAVVSRGQFHRQAEVLLAADAD